MDIDEGFELVPQQVFMSLLLAFALRQVWRHRHYVALSLIGFPWTILELTVSSHLEARVFLEIRSHVDTVV
jgi:hypothetical protein